MEEEMDFQDIVPCEDIGSEGKFLKENIIKICKEELSSLKLDSRCFGEGMKSVSYLCGAITALSNVGITPDKAMDYLVDKEATQIAIAHDKEMAEIQKDVAIKTAELSFVSNNS